MHKLAELCVKRPVFATMLIVALMTVGGFSFFTLGVDLFPKIDLPTVSVSVSNPGASAEEVETDITKRVEDAVNTISGIDDINSTSVEGASTVVITFELDKNGDVGAQEIRDKVYKDVAEVLKQPALRHRLEERSFELSGIGPAGFKNFIADDKSKWRRVITEANIKGD